MIRKVLAVIAGWSSGLVLLGVGMALNARFGPLAVNSRRLAEIRAARGVEAATAYMVSREAHEVMGQAARLMIYTTLPLTCLVAAMVAASICRRATARTRIAVALTGALGPLAFQLLVLHAAEVAVVPFAVGATVGVAAAVGWAVLTGRRS